MKECKILRFWMSDSFNGQIEAEGNGVSERVNIGDVSIPYQEVLPAIEEGIDELRRRGWEIPEDEIADFNHSFYLFWKRIWHFCLFVTSLWLIDREADALMAANGEFPDPP